MTTADAVRSAFPELEEIRDEQLRQQVLDVWVRAVDDSGYDDLEAVPWWPPAERNLEGGTVPTIEHVGAVTRIAIGIADSMAESVGTEIDRDVVVAGALLHDISKLYELDGEDTGELHEWVPHPHYGVHVLADAGFPAHLQHIAVSHSPNSAVEPRTIEAEIVSRADELAVQGLFWKRNGTLRP